MARYAPEHKDATRRRMVEASARRFKREGFDGAGISALVADAGLTNGAFYGHFASKDDLIATVVATQLATQLAWIEGSPPGLASLASLVGEYLSPEHRDNREDGCPSAALLDEICRQDLVAREAYTQGAQAIVRAIARHLEADGVSDARERAMGLYTLLVSSLQLARAVTDPAFSEEILSSAHRNALRLLAPSEPPPSPHQEIS